MKPINCFIASGLLSLSLGCSQPKNKTVEKQEAPVKLKETELAAGSDARLVIPGEKMGKISLGQDMNEVFKILGKADDGDAAMGKAWSIWHITSKNPADTGEIAIYSTYKDSTMTSKVVRQVMVNTGDYATGNGLRNTVDLSEISKKLNSLKRVATYINEKKDTLYVYDSETEGIAFDVKKENSHLFTRAMTIHAKKESVNNTYLTIHPGWRKVQ